MRVAYVRVSTVEQNEERQIKGLEIYDIDKWFIEKISGKNINRPKLQEMLEYIRENDTVYVHDFSRLARSTSDLLNIVKILEDKGVYLVSNKESIDTSSTTGKLMITMIGAINEFERQNLLERQKEGIALAKEQGKYKGRKKIEKPSNWEEIYQLWKMREIPSNRAMELLGLKRNTFYKLVKEQQQNNIK